MAASAICTIQGCNKPSFAKGWCSSHYHRWRRHGDPMKGRTSPGERLRYYEEVVLKYEGDDCLIWPYTRCDYGYGRMKRNGKDNPVHRFLCEDVNGPPPSSSYHAAHSCGNGHRGCVNKHHLSWKTPTGNNADKILHGTLLYGERHPGSKLTEKQAREIYSLRGIEMQSSVAKRYGISFRTVSNIQLGKIWSFIDQEAKEPAK